MRKLIFLLAIACLGQLAAESWGMEITVPAESPEHSLVAFTCDAPQAGCTWTVSGPRGEEPVYLAGAGGVFTGPPGVYRLMMSPSATPGRGIFVRTVIVEGGDVEPPFPPEPPDPPDPPPEPGIKQVTVIYEAQGQEGNGLTPKQAAKQAAILADLTWRQWLLGRGHPQPRVLDQHAKAPDGSPSPALAELLPHVKGKLPVLFSVSEDGSYEQIPLPKTAQGIIDFVEKWGG